MFLLIVNKHVHVVGNSNSGSLAMNIESTLDNVSDSLAWQMLDSVACCILCVTIPVSEANGDRRGLDQQEDVSESD